MKSLHCCLVGRAAAGSGAGDAGCFLPGHSQLLSPCVWGGGSARCFPPMPHSRLGRLCPPGIYFLLYFPCWGERGCLWHRWVLSGFSARLSCKRWDFAGKPRKKVLASHRGKVLGWGGQCWLSSWCCATGTARAWPRCCGYTCSDLGFSNLTPWLLSWRERPGHGGFGI